MPAQPLKRCRALLFSHLRENAGALLAAGLASAGYAAAELFAPWPLKVIIDYVLLHRSLPAWLQSFQSIISGRPEWVIGLIAASILVVALAKGIFAYLQVFVTSRVGYELVHRLRRELFGHMQRLSLNVHNRARSGEMLTKVTADTSVLKDVFAGGLLEVASHGLVIISTFVILIGLNSRVAAVAALTLPVLAFAIFTIYRNGKTSARRQRKREGEVAAHIGEALHLTALVRAFSRVQAEEDRFARQSEQALSESIRTARVEAAASRTVELLNAAGVASAVFFGGVMALGGSITPGDLLVFTSYLSGVYKPLRNLAKLSSQFSKAMASAERIEELLEQEVESNDTGIDPGRLRGEVEFRDVWFGYEAARPVLRSASFSVKRGEHVALVGASGEGKSTVASLLLRFYQPQHGAVLVDGRNIAEMNGEAYRRQIGVVLQDALLFGTTIAENIAYGRPNASRAEIEAAAKTASAHDFIAQLPAGYDTILNERATMLSGGQRQRISLARALLKNPSILILDEPTAAVDGESAAKIHETVSASRRGLTTLVIAHRFHAMEHFDRIFVLQDGTICEEGTHAELLLNKSAYWRLAHAQGTREQVVARAQQEVTT